MMIAVAALTILAILDILPSGFFVIIFLPLAFSGSKKLSKITSNQRQQLYLYCPSCGFPLRGYENYCPRCGHRLRV